MLTTADKACRDREVREFSRGTGYEQGFYTALDYKSILRWNLTPADLEDWASGVPEPSGDAKIEELFRVLLDTEMVERSPKLGYAVLQVMHDLLSDTAGHTSRSPSVFDEGDNMPQMMTWPGPKDRPTPKEK